MKKIKDIPVIELQPSTFTITFCDEKYGYYERTDALDIIYNNPYLFEDEEESESLPDGCVKEPESLPDGFDSVDELTTFLQEWPKYEYKLDPFKNPKIKQDQWIQVEIKIVDHDNNNNINHETHVEPYLMWYFFTQNDPNWDYITKSFDSKNVPQDLMFHGCSFTSDPSIAQGINIGKCSVPSDFYREGAFYTTNNPIVALDRAISVTKNKCYQYPSVIIYPNIHKQYQANPGLFLSFTKTNDDDDELLEKYTCHDFGETPTLEWKEQISFCKKYDKTKGLIKSSRYGWITGLIPDNSKSIQPSIQPQLQPQLQSQPQPQPSIQYGFRAPQVIKYIDLLCLGAVIIKKNN